MNVGHHAGEKSNRFVVRTVSVVPVGNVLIIPASSGSSLPFWCNHQEDEWFAPREKRWNHIAESPAPTRTKAYGEMLFSPLHLNGPSNFLQYNKGFRYLQQSPRQTYSSRLNPFRANGDSIHSHFPFSTDQLLSVVANDTTTPRNVQWPFVCSRSLRKPPSSEKQ